MLFTTVEGQMRVGLGLPEAIAGLVLASEPVWAFVTGANATPAQASEVHGYSRELLSELRRRTPRARFAACTAGRSFPRTPGFVSIGKKTAQAGAVRRN
jgi:Triosephosphate isomerase